MTANDGDKPNPDELRISIMSEMMVLEISVASVRGGISHIKHHPGAALVRNQLEKLETLANEAADSVGVLRDDLWMHFGVGGLGLGA